MVENGCPFCEPHASRRFHEGEGIVGLWDGFPVAAGHALLVPKRHVATWFDATPISEPEKKQIGRDNAIKLFKLDLEANPPTGMNIHPTEEPINMPVHKVSFKRNIPGTR